MDEALSLSDLDIHPLRPPPRHVGTIALAATTLFFGLASGHGRLPDWRYHLRPRSATRGRPARCSPSWSAVPDLVLARSTWPVPPTCRRALPVSRGASSSWRLAPRACAWLHDTRRSYRATTRSRVHRGSPSCLLPSQHGVGILSRVISSSRSAAVESARSPAFITVWWGRGGRRARPPIRATVVISSALPRLARRLTAPCGVGGGGARSRRPPHPAVRRFSDGSGSCPESISRRRGPQPSRADLGHHRSPPELRAHQIVAAAAGGPPDTSRRDWSLPGRRSS